MFNWLKNMITKENTKESAKEIDYNSIIEENKKLRNKNEELNDIIGFYEFLGINLSNCEDDGFDYEKHYLTKLKQAYSDNKKLKSKIGSLDKKLNNLKKIELLLLNELENSNNKIKELSNKIKDLKMENEMLKSVKSNNFYYKEIKTKNPKQDEESVSDNSTPKTLNEVKDILQRLDLRC